ncbi:hypothetical protein C2U54_20580 [Leclercia sp. LSNIH1]|nr:hypothetical protein C2U54_20580 [Leclercia sp. LSNIH1]POV36921.1 hypothetical protein C3388_04600 [Leclercia sp. LSNIH5]POW69139.1 hypothetical protein C3389_01845 [Leclercia sp. LSNIH2]
MDKTKTAAATKIFTAIIINFIYYRHSDLNVCLSRIEPNAMHSVFFTHLYANLNNLCYLPETITTIN